MTECLTQCSALQGDRAGICVTQLDPKLIERGLACTPATIPTFSSAIIAVEKIRFYAGEASAGQPVAGAPQSTQHALWIESLTRQGDSPLLQALAGMYGCTAASQPAAQAAQQRALACRQQAAAHASDSQLGT